MLSTSFTSPSWRKRSRSRDKLKMGWRADYILIQEYQNADIHHLGQIPLTLPEHEGITLVTNTSFLQMFQRSQIFHIMALPYIQVHMCRRKTNFLFCAQSYLPLFHLLVKIMFINASIYNQS